MSSYATSQSVQDSLVNYYNKQQVDQKISQIQITPVDLSNYYNKQQVDQKIVPVDLSNYYNKQQVDQKIVPVDQSNYYNKQQVDQKIILVDLSNYYNKQQVDQKIVPVDLSKQFLASPTDTTALDSNYTIQHTQVVNLNKRYLQIVPDKYGTMLDLGYQIYTSQVYDFNFQLELYLGTNNYVKDKNKGIYFKDYVQTKDLANYLPTAPSSSTDLNAYYTITTNQIKDLGIFMNDYVTQGFVDDLIQEQLLNYLPKNTQKNTLLNQNYQLNMNQIIQSTKSDYFGSQLSTNYPDTKYLLIFDNNQSDKNIQLLKFQQLQISSPQITDFNQKLDFYMLGQPPSQIPLSSNYSIQTTQILDFQNQLQKYMLVTPQPFSQLSQNYSVMTAQITDQYQVLSKYLIASPTQPYLISNNFQLQASQIIDLQQYINKKVNLGNYLTINQTQQTYLNQNYVIYAYQVTDLKPTVITLIQQNSLQAAPTQTTALNTNYTITSAQITDFNAAVNALLPNLGNGYLPVNPSYEIQLNANYSIASGQIPDFSAGVMQVLPQQLSKYMLLSPPNQSYLDLNYLLQSSNFKTNTINPNILINNSITATQLQQGCIQNSTLSSSLQQFFQLGQPYSLTDMFGAKNANVTYPCLTQQQNVNFPLGFFHTNYNKYAGVNQTTSYSYYGASSFFPYSNFNSYINYGSNPQPSIQFASTLIYGSNVSPNNYGSVGMYNSVGGFVSSITASTYSIHLAGPSFGNFLVSFGRDGIQQDLVSYINSSGQYVVVSDENMKNNIQEKTNYQEQLERKLFAQKKIKIFSIILILYRSVRPVYRIDKIQQWFLNNKIYLFIQT